MNWLHRIVDSYSESEAPSKFFYWAAMACISAVVKKNIFLERHMYKLYPNIYVFIVADSGMKKGVPINMARTLVTKADTVRIISGRGSMPAIIRDLGKVYTLENGGMIKDAQAFLLSGELAAFLVKDPDALTILTDIHDTHAYEKFWTNTLKGQGPSNATDKLKSPCITLLGATNEEHFPEAVPQTAIGGGFIARTFIVYSRERGNLNSLTSKPTKLINTDKLAEYLVDLSKIQGEFLWTNEAVVLYDKWYYQYMAEIRSDPTGTRNRLGDQILKAAMLISLADNFDLKLRAHHIEEAIQVSLDCELGMKQVTMGTGRSNLAFATRLVMRELIINPEHKIARSKLLSKYWGEFDYFDLDRIVETLLAADAIEIQNQSGKNATYVLKSSALAVYMSNVVDLKRGIQ